MYCPRCGESNEEGSRFCVACGAELRASETETSEASGGSGDEPGARTGGDPAEGPERPRFWRRVIGTTRRERWVSGATLAAIVITVIAFILLDAPPHDSSTDPFLKASDERCLQAKDEIAQAAEALASTKPGAKDKEDASQAYVDELLQVVLRWRAEQRQLQPSADQQAAADAYLAALLDVSVSLADLSDAIGDGNDARTAKAAQEADAATGALEAEIDELGLQRCGALSFSPNAAG